MKIYFQWPLFRTCLHSVVTARIQEENERNNGLDNLVKRRTSSGLQYLQLQFQQTENTFSTTWTRLPTLKTPIQWSHSYCLGPERSSQSCSAPNIGHARASRHISPAHFPCFMKYCSAIPSSPVMMPRYSPVSALLLRNVAHPCPLIAPAPPFIILQPAPLHCLSFRPSTVAPI